MLGASMRRRLLSLSLALLLLLTQQLGAVHLLSHVLHPGGHGPATLIQANQTALPAAAHADEATQAAAGDALCQVCLVLATLVAAALPAVWGWRPPRPQPVALVLPAPRLLARRASAPYRARGPPGLPALS